MAVTRRDLAAVGLWAAGTAGVLLAALAPSALQATDPPGGRVLVATIEQPALLDNGVRLSVQRIDLTTRPQGKTRSVVEARTAEPVYEVRAANLSNKPATASWEERLTVTQPPSPGARSMSLPMIVWKKQATVQLAAGEIKLIRVAPGVRAGAGQSVALQLIGATDSVTVDAFVAGPPAPVATGTVMPTTAPSGAASSMAGFMPFGPATQPSAAAGNP